MTKLRGGQTTLDNLHLNHASDNIFDIWALCLSKGHLDMMSNMSVRGQEESKQ